MLFDVPVHDLSAGDCQLFQDSRNKSGASTSSSAHLSCRLKLRRGGRHLLLGKNGCGKTTLLRAIRDGHLGIPRDVRTFLVDQELALLDPDCSAMASVLAADEGRRQLQRRRHELEEALAAAPAPAVAEEASLELAAVYEALAQGGEDDAVREKRARKILAGLGFTAATMDGRISDLSGGWKMRAALAVALFMEPQLLMLDEPTNHLDMQAISWLQRYLVEHYSGSKTLLCVSHDRSFINAVLTDIIVLEGKSLTSFAGSLEDFEQAAENRAKHLERQAEVLESKRAAAKGAIAKHVAQEQRSVKNKAANRERNKYADGQALLYGSEQSSKVTALNRKLQRVGMERTLDGRRFKASEHGCRLGSVEENEGEQIGRALTAAPLFQKKDPALKFGFGRVSYLGVAEDTPILQVQEAEYCYPGCSRPTLTGVNVSLSTKSRVAITGANGTGKSTLVRLITAGAEPSAGQVWRHRNLTIAHLDQHESDKLQMSSSTPLAYLQECFPEKLEQELCTLLGSFGVKGSMVMQPLSTLSGGQRVRVAFAKICALSPQMLVLDEPTNHLDIYSIDALTDALQDFQGAVVVVTHNRSLLKAICDEVLVVEDGSCRSVRLADESPGGWLLQNVFQEAAGGRFGVGLPKSAPAAGRHVGASQTRPGREQTRRLGACSAAGSGDKLLAPLAASYRPTVAQTPEASLQPLRATEKEFLRCVKRVREMLKLEAMKTNGTLLKTQAEKLQRKEEALKELAEAVLYLPSDSSLREKNADLLGLL